MCAKKRGHFDESLNQQKTIFVNPSLIACVCVVTLIYFFCKKTRERVQKNFFFGICRPPNYSARKLRCFQWAALLSLWLSLRMFPQGRLECNNTNAAHTLRRLYYCPLSNQTIVFCHKCQNKHINAVL